MAHFSPYMQNQRGVPGSRHNVDQDYDDDDDEDDSFSSPSHRRGDKIKRNYISGVANNHNDPQNAATAAGSSSTSTSNFHQRNNIQETIQVKLNESYFANERKAAVNLLANCRQKLNSLQMFNPAKNQSIREQQEMNWNENEKYTLDSLNEIKSDLDEQFQWTRPEDKREVWPSKMQYFFAITSYSIGLGNVIRFPILVQKNGGLAFIIPFVIMLLVEGIPLFYLELAVGQRMRKAAISCWNLVSPFAAGIGIASAAVSFVIGLYYNTMVAWTLLYLWGSVTQKPLPFTVCPEKGEQPRNSSSSSSSGSGPVFTADSLSSNEASRETECQMSGPFQHYWYRKTLQVSEDVDTWSNFNWPVLLALLAAWLISYLCLARGLSSSKRIVYITFTCPYVILTVFFFKATSLRGMSDGIYYLFEPKWSKLTDPYVWLQSAAQVFFSLGLGFGGLIALSSYNPVNNNCYRDAIKVSLVNFFTSIYAGVVIFAILGYKAHMSYDKCLVQREQTINYYLSDYTLKAIDYGAVFDPAIQNRKENKQDEAIEAIESSSFDTITSKVSDGTTNEEMIANNVENNDEDEDDKKTNEEKDEKEEVKVEEEKRRENEKGKIKVKGKSKGKVNERKTRSSEDNTSKEPANTKINQDKKSEIKSPEQQINIKKKNKKKKMTTKGNNKEKPLDVISSSSSAAESAKLMTKTTTFELPNTSISAETKSTTSTTTTTAATTTTTTSTTSSPSTTTTTKASSKPSFTEQQQLEDNSSTNTDLEDSSTDYYDSSDAIASIKSLDKQLDLASSKMSSDYGDSDTEFIIDASSLISKSDLDKVIERIPDLQKCSVRNELDEATKGTGLVFIVITEAISQFENAPIWAMGFFFMLLMLGLDSQFGNLEGLLSSIADLNSVNSIKRQWITGIICCTSLILSMFMFAHGAGSYMFAIFDEYAGSFSLILIALFELIAISYIYGLKRFCDDCELMTGKRPPFLILLSWKYISPILLLIVIIATIHEFTISLSYEAWVGDHLVDKIWPNWCITFGVILIIACIIWIPAIAILKIFKINIIPEESLSQCWFPAEELREYHDLQEEYKISKIERFLFGFRSDDD